jgi:hypothetical protein
MSASLPTTDIRQFDATSLTAAARRAPVYVIDDNYQRMVGICLWSAFAFGGAVRAEKHAQEIKIIYQFQ